MRNIHTKTSPLCGEWWITLNLSFNIRVALDPFSAASLNPRPSNASAPQEPSATPLALHSLIPCLPPSINSVSPVSVQTANPFKAIRICSLPQFTFLWARTGAQAPREQLLKLQMTEQITSFFHFTWFKVSCLAYSTRGRYWWSSIWRVTCTAEALGIFISVSPMNPSLCTKRHKQDLLRIMRTVFTP